MQVSEVLPWEHIQEVDVQRALNSFIGDIMQIPPMYSAIKVRAYLLRCTFANTNWTIQ